MVKKEVVKIKPIIKPVSFTQNSEYDLEIIKFIEENNLAFSSYVKDLITSDMRKVKDKNEIADAINNLANIICTSGINIINTDNNVNKNNNTEYVDEEKKNIIGNILNMSK